MGPSTWIRRRARLPAPRRARRVGERVRPQPVQRRPAGDLRRTDRRRHPPTQADQLLEQPGARVLSPTGSAFQTITPSFSPDSCKITFTSNRASSSNFDIYVMNVNGTGVTRPHPEPRARHGASVLPRRDQDRLCHCPLRQPRHRRDERRRHQRPAPDHEWHGGHRAGLAARRPGDRLFARAWPGREGHLRDQARRHGRASKVTFTPKEDHDATYSPNGDQLVITSERNISPPYGNVHKIRVSDGADLGDLTADQELGSGDPFWSRDGTLIAYFNAVVPFLRGPQQLFVMGATGPGKFRIPGERGPTSTPRSASRSMTTATEPPTTSNPARLDRRRSGPTAFAPARPRSCASTGPIRGDGGGSRRSGCASRRGAGCARWVRFSVRGRAFGLFDGQTDTYGRTRRAGGRRLRSRLLTLDLRRTRVTGLSRRKLRLVLALASPGAWRASAFRLRAQAEDRRGRNQEDELGRLRLVR